MCYVGAVDLVQEADREDQRCTSMRAVAVEVALQVQAWSGARTEHLDELEVVDLVLLARSARRVARAAADLTLLHHVPRQHVARVVVHLLVVVRRTSTCSHFTAIDY